MGARLIRSGEADLVIAGGTEAAITPITVAGFAQATALSRYPGDPASASRPFAADRAGFVLGEGAGIAVLESSQHAADRGARVRAVLAGAGVAADAYHVTGPTVLSVEHDVIPPTRNLAHTALDPQITLDVVTTQREEPQRAAVTNSFGFGGQNVSLLFTGQHS
jgi:3-oxoacyl-[acyl-carrier-protein] synthase II